MKRLLVFLPLVIFMALFLSCRCQQETAVQVDLDIEETAVKTAMNQFWQSFETSDISLVSEVMADDPDMVIIGTDAAERWVGFEEFRTAMEQQFAAMESLQTSLHDEVFNIHHSGEVAWYSGIVDFKGTSMGEDFEIADLRVTAVLEKRDATWVIVQYHGSMPVVGQLVEY
jgi:ketosteroid isomerase-like protein